MKIVSTISSTPSNRMWWLRSCYRYWSSGSYVDGLRYCESSGGLGWYGYYIQCMAVVKSAGGLETPGGFSNNGIHGVAPLYCVSELRFIYS